MNALFRSGPACLLFLLLIVFDLFSRSANATHAAGMELTYRNTGPLQYEITLTFYRDCAGIPEPGFVQISVSSDNLGYAGVLTAYKVSGPATEITAPCATAATTCSGGSLTGIRRFVYTDTILLPAPQSDWRFSFSECCRNCALTTILNPCATGSQLYVEATLDNLAAPGNNSPRFSNLPLVFACTGQQIDYNHGVLEPDGDSLDFSLVAPKTGTTTTVSFIPPATASFPISSTSGFVLDPATGQFTFTPGQVQTAVMALLVREYRAGKCIGSVIRDIQVYAQPCSNNLPTISGIDGTSMYTATACPEMPVCFDLYSGDADSAQEVTLACMNPIAGAAWSISGGPRPVLHFCWTPPVAEAGLPPKYFVVTVTDNACPFGGSRSYAIGVAVKRPEIGVTATDATCYGKADGTAAAACNNAGIVAWYWNSSPPQSGATAMGLEAGTYTVTGTDANGCSNTAEAAVGEPPALGVAALITDLTCHGSGDGAVALAVTGGLPSYSYAWSAGQTSATINQLAAGTYAVLVTDVNGCTVQHQVLVEQPDALFIQAAITPAACHGENTGAIDVTVSGGMPGYQYTWNDGALDEDRSFLPAGNYTLQVTDQHVCETVQTFAVPQPDALAFMGWVTDAGYGLCDGAIDPVPAGGVMPYSYVWSTGAQSQQLGGLCPGTYALILTDDNWCQLTDSFTVGELLPSAVSEPGCSTPQVPILFPNPLHGAGTLSFFAVTTGKAAGDLVDLRGRVVQRLFDKDVVTGTRYLIPVYPQLQIADGTYFVTISYDGIYLQQAGVVLLKKR